MAKGKTQAQTESLMCIHVIEMYAMGFHLGNAFKLLVGYKQHNDLKKLDDAAWYLARFLSDDKTMFRQQQLTHGRTQLAAMAGEHVPAITPPRSVMMGFDFDMQTALAFAGGCILDAANSCLPANIRSSAEEALRQLLLYLCEHNGSMAISLPNLQLPSDKS